MKRIAVLASGQGTNLEAILEAAAAGDLCGRVTLVISDKEEAPALKRAEKRGITALFVDPRAYAGREDYDRALVSALVKADVELVLLAGFMRILSPLFVKSFPLQIMNIHPSLLPSFTGADGIEQALAHGVKVTGCTVHFVDEGLDSGPIILQEAVPVIQGDSPATLRQRIQALEHRLYTTAINLYCRGRLKVEEKRCFILE